VEHQEAELKLLSEIVGNRYLDRHLFLKRNYSLSVQLSSFWELAVVVEESISDVFDKI